MVVTLTANACIDKTLALERFEIGKTNRAELLRSDFGGKGINVSAALANLGVATCAVAVSREGDDAAFRADLDARGIPHRLVTFPGNLRCCNKYFDRSTRRMIEINELGSPLPEPAAAELLKLLSGQVHPDDVVVLSGSLPVGFPADFYRSCIREIKRISPGSRIIVDAEKEPLLLALEAGPFLLKPNVHEFEATFHTRIGSDAELDREARRILSHYRIGILCISLGAEGAYITDGRQSFRCRAPRVEVRSLQGAGDSLVAGICAALEEHLELPELLRRGCAAAGDTVSREGTSFCTPDGVAGLLAQDLGVTRIF